MGDQVVEGVALVATLVADKLFGAAVNPRLVVAQVRRAVEGFFAFVAGVWPVDNRNDYVASRMSQKMCINSLLKLFVHISGLQ